MKIIIAIIAFSFLFTGIALAQDTEEITLTTYYPAPYGDYEELQTASLSVGGYTFPTALGQDGQILKTDGSGNISWQSSGAGFGVMDSISGGGAGSYTFGIEYITTQAGFVTCFMKVDDGGLARYHGLIRSSATAAWIPIAGDSAQGFPAGRWGLGSFCMPVPAGWRWTIEQAWAESNLLELSIHWFPLE
jgi:hypothetical protein